MARLTVLVLVGRGDKYGDALLDILQRDVSERLALRVEVPVRIYRPDDFAPLVIDNLDFDLIFSLYWGAPEVVTSEVHRLTGIEVNTVYL